ncbi:carbohydrate ABC transporter permease [Ruminococcus flavefaciens]|uniref:Multiple sugar transport system permease protein n=1 Tax=Ruminococcus flavefaciens TaxID=1265 RepID=A0A1K1Q101_RUMFL|nr:sugar ABC transporter permease [Ruminococcus flavefaciens]SFW53409.1 multiple sugar transport system permease protein [Ruminococcus flavefaciens]
MTKCKTKKQNVYCLLFLLPSLLGVMIFIFIPFLDSVRKSFFTAVSEKFIGAKNYEVIMKNDAFALAVKNTALFTAVCIPALIIISFFLSYLITKIKCIRLIKSVLLFPLAIPTAAMVLIWQILFSDNGYINNILVSTGHGSVSFLSSKTAFWVLVGSYIWKNLGYTVILWVTGIMKISGSVIEAAKVDGAGEADILFRIIIPNLKPTLYTITIISFLNSFKVFREAFLVAGAYPHDSIYLLQHLFNNWFINMDLDKMAAAAVLVFSVIFAAIVLLQRMWNKEE